MPKLHSVRISKATKHYFCLRCGKPCPTGSRIGGYRSVHVCEMHIEWLRSTPVKPPKTGREKKSYYTPVSRCRACGASTGFHGESLCRDCMDTQKYVPIFTVHRAPVNENTKGIITSMKDYQGAVEW